MLYRRTILALAAISLALLPAGRAAAQALDTVDTQPVVPGNKPAYLNGIGIDQKLGQQVPLDLTFKDETGKTVQLGQYFGGKKPVILTLVYYSCPMLCTLVLNDLTRGMNALDLSAGDDFQVVTVSFDPKETPALAADKKQTYLQSYRRPGAEEGWHFLTGDAANIKALTAAVGFRYKWDPKFSQFIHPSGIMILTPTGLLSRYFFGVDYDLKDLKLSLQEASGNKIGTLSDQVLLYCFHYDPTSGKYTLMVTRMLKVGGVVTLAAIGTFWFAMSRRGDHPRPPSPPAPPTPTLLA